MEESLIWVKTRRYSRVLEAILREYGPGAVVRIDGVTYAGPGVATLLHTWCTNRSITNTINFELIRDGTTLFGFHDHPRDLWAAPSERQFVERLHREGLASHRVLPVDAGGLNWLVQRLKGLFRI